MTSTSALYPLDHPKTKRAAGEFRRARLTRASRAKPITYEHFYRLFSDPNLTFREIARRTELADQSVHRIYDTYFIGIVSNETGAERLHAITQRRQEEALKALKVPDKPGLKKVEELALEQKLEVRPFVIPRDQGRLGHVSQTKLRIKGVGCKVHPITTCSTPKGGRTQRYGVVKMSRKNVEDTEIHIFVFLCEGVSYGPFIIPKEVLLETLFGDDDIAYLYIPIERGTRKRGDARLNPRNYHRTWNYIRLR